MYKKLEEAAKNVIAEGGDGWWGSDQLGEETDSWVPQVDCDFIEQASPQVILKMIKRIRELEKEEIIRKYLDVVEGYK